MKKHDTFMVAEPGQDFLVGISLYKDQPEHLKYGIYYPPLLDFFRTYPVT